MSNRQPLFKAGDVTTSAIVRILPKVGYTFRCDGLEQPASRFDFTPTVFGNADDRLHYDAHFLIAGVNDAQMHYNGLMMSRPRAIYTIIHADKVYYVECVMFELGAKFPS
jgi:hypothetical protein